MDKGKVMKTQDWFKMVGESCCLIACYSFCSCCSFSESWVLTEQQIDEAITKDVWFVYNDGTYLDKNNNCIDGYAVLRDLSGFNKWSIDVKPITDLSDTEGRLAIVQYDNGKFSHNVVVYKNEIVYNPLSMSNCVNHGKPTKARLISCGREIVFPTYLGVK